MHRISKSLGTALVVGVMLYCSGSTPAHAQCGPVVCCTPCCAPCIPCCPIWPPCGPHFSFAVKWNHLTPYVPPSDVPLDLDVNVTNWEAYGWNYWNTEYGFYLFDEYANYLPGRLVLKDPPTQIHVDPKTSHIDHPKVTLYAGGLNLDRRYTVIVTLRCHQDHFFVIPKSDASKPKEGAASSLTSVIVVTLPTDARLTIDDHVTRSTSSTRMFRTPVLDAGKNYTCTLRAEVVRGGLTQHVSRQLSFTAGEELRVDLGRPGDGTWNTPYAAVRTTGSPDAALLNASPSDSVVALSR